MDREALEEKWKANEAELERIASMTSLDRQLFGKQEDELLGEQDAIEFKLGNQDVGMRTHWSSFARVVSRLVLMKQSL